MSGIERTSWSSRLLVTTALTSAVLLAAEAAKTVSMAQTIGPDTPVPYLLDRSGPAGGPGTKGQSTYSTAGTGGTGGPGNPINAEVTSGTTLLPSGSSPSSSPTVSLTSNGGAGGQGGTAYEAVVGYANGGAGGTAGVGGTVSLQLDQDANIFSFVPGGGAINIISNGGQGGNGGPAANRGSDGTPSSGAAGGTISFGMVQSAQIGSTLSTPQGIAAVTLSSTGGDGGTQPNGQTTNIKPAAGANGGAGGTGGAIQTISGGIGGMILSSGGSGVVARSQGGHGNDGGFADSGGSEGAKGGNGGAGGAGGTISLTLAGPGAFITAQGPSGATGAQIQVDGPNNTTLPAATSGLVVGVAALSLGGTGGNGGIADGDYDKATAGSGGAAGPGGVIGVTTTGGTIATTGYGAAGILGLSTGGSGGSGGNAGAVFRAHGGNGAAGGDGNQVNLLLCRTGACQSGSGSVLGPAVISTTGEDADAVVALSVGGGGGYGGDVSVGGVGAAFAIGGQGAQGGKGGNVSVQNGYYSPPSISSPLNGHVISTEGEYARGLVGLSVGGGGGRGGDASATNFGLISLSIGGVGGQGGDASFASVSNGGIIQTAGAHSTAIDAQSIGGGGGAGGAATSVTVGAQVTTAVAVGGRGGVGGNGFNAYAANYGQVGTLGDSAIGVFAQSVGGGGGHGGASVAKTFQVYSSQDPPVPSVNLTVSLGGAGGIGGSGGSASVDNTGLVFTGGQNSHALVAQSVGGGGGDGGAATAYSQQFRASTVSVSTTIGGAGAGGGLGGPAQVRNGGLVWTLDRSSYGIIAQSVGGGGGAGGYGQADTGNFRGGATPNVQASVVLGGSGGSGNFGGPVTVNNYIQPDPQGPILPGSILTRGDHSVGIFAQSVGGGGGIGAHSLAQGSGGQVNVNVALGGSGGSGNHGGAVTVDNGAGAILTAGASAHAIFAQSVGGGGGRGGDAATGAGTDPEIAAYSFVASGAGIGGANQVIGNIYDLKDNSPTNVDLSGRLATMLTTYNTENDAAGPQPVPQQQSFVSKITADVGVGLSGKGGSGGNGGDVTVSSAGSIETRGPRSFGIYAQSVGGGGGDGGATHASTSNDVIPGSKLNASVGIGGGGGSAGDGGTVQVTNTGVITTDGDLSHAIFAQSVGGGGGTGGLTVARSSAVISVNLGLGGSGGASGAGGAVTVNSLQGARINTYGTAAVGIAAQSVGGGGGLATLMSSDVPSGGGRAQSSGGPFDIPNLTIFRQTTSGASGASGQGGAVTVTMNGSGLGANDARPYIVTTGADAYGILAQSVGSGGGWYSGVAPSGSTSLSTLLPPAGSSSGNGGAVAVSLDIGAYIYTSGAGAVGILAQSVGGGGGLIGGMSQVRADQGFTATPNARNGQGGNVTVSLLNNGNVVTTGARAHGIFAQSVGGGGGVLSQSDGSGFTFAGSGSYAGCSGSSCTGAVSVTLGANTVSRASGQDAYAIFVQSRGNGVNTTTVTLNGGYAESWGQSAGAIYVDGAGANTINNNGGVIDNGTLNGAPTPSGLAIVGSSNAGFITVTNTGTINGSHSFPNGGTINNQLGGVLNVGSTVNLGASGRLVNGGLVTLGAAPGQAGGRTTTLVGDFEQTATGTLRVNLQAGANQADRLLVNGTARLAGAVDVVVADPANLKPGAKQATILTATGGVTQNALRVSLASTPVMRFGLAAPDAGNLNLSYAVDYAAAEALRAERLASSNRGEVGRALNAIMAGDAGELAPLAGRLAALPTARAVATTLDALSGEAAADVQQTVFAAHQAYTATVLRHVVGEERGAGTPAAPYAVASLSPVGPPANAQGMRVWVGGFGGNDLLNGTDGQGSLHTQTAGALIGLDKWFGSDRMAGFSVGGGSSDFSVADRASKGHTTSVNVSAYGLQRFGQAYVSGVLAYGNFATDLKRDGLGGATGLTAAGRRGSVTSNALGGRVELGWRQPVAGGAVVLTPFAALEVDHLWQDRFAETAPGEPGAGGGGLALRFNQVERTSVPLTLGARAGTSFQLGGGRVLGLSAELGWVHEFNPQRSVTAAFVAAPNATFRVLGVSASRDAAQVGLDAKLSLTRNVALFANFTGRFSGVETAIGGSGGLQVTW